MKGDTWTVGESVEVQVGKAWRIATVESLYTDRNGTFLNVRLHAGGKLIRCDGDKVWKAGERKENS